MPGTLGPVAEEVYLMISVSDGRRSESNVEVVGVEVDVFVAAAGEEGLAGMGNPPWETRAAYELGSRAAA